VQSKLNSKFGAAELGQQGQLLKVAKYGPASVYKYTGGNGETPPTCNKPILILGQSSQEFGNNTILPN